MVSVGKGAERQDRLEEVERRLDRLEWRGRATERGRDLMRELVPTETRRHLRAAGREQLLAARSLIEHWIGWLDEDDEERAKRREEIRIE